MNKWKYSPKLCQVIEHQTQSENAKKNFFKTAIKDQTADFSRLTLEIRKK